MHFQSILIIELLKFFGAVIQFWWMRSSNTLTESKCYDTINAPEWS